MICIVTIQDKSLYGEPDVALAVVDAPDEEAAYAAARPMIVQLAEGARTLRSPCASSGTREVLSAAGPGARTLRSGCLRGRA